MSVSENKRLIFLVGFMGSGKTYLGEKLAYLFSCEFIDLDHAIEKNENKSIADIFTRQGEEYFREQESSVLKSFSEKKNAVIATGGGTPCFHDNMSWMNEHGVTIYLQASPDFLFQRLKNEIQHRPLLSGKSDDDVKIFIAEKLREREEFYLQASVVSNAENISAASLAEMLKPRLL